MRGRIGLVIGLGAGYVLGSRAGRARYEQIKTQWLKVWNLDPVQQQVGKVQDFAKSQAAAVPGALFHGAVKVVSRFRLQAICAGVSAPDVSGVAPCVPGACDCPEISSALRYASRAVCG